MDARTVVRADAVFEAVLGLGLVVAAAADALGGGDFPRPVGTVLLVGAGAVLVLLGIVLWSGRVGVKALAAGNAVSAVAALVWVAFVSGFSAAGAGIVAVAVAGLVGLAAAQVATLRP